MFYIPNALNKLLEPDQTGKIVENSAVFFTAGIFLLIATALFLHKKTILIGTFMLALCMSCIVLIDMYKGKPSEVVILILMPTIFAAYIRKPQLFHQKQND
jgi:ABC-type Fe3+-siderophore transport system permease subunit